METGREGDGTQLAARESKLRAAPGNIIAHQLGWLLRRLCLHSQAVLRIAKDSQLLWWWQGDAKPGKSSLGIPTIMVHALEASSVPAFLGNPLPTQPPQGFKPPDGSVAAQMQRQQMDSLYQRTPVLSPMHVIGIPPAYTSLYPLPAMGPAPMQPQAPRIEIANGTSLPMPTLQQNHPFSDPVRAAHIHRQLALMQQVPFSVNPPQPGPVFAMSYPTAQSEGTNSRPPQPAASRPTQGMTDLLVLDDNGVTNGERGHNPAPLASPGGAPEEGALECK